MVVKRLWSSLVALLRRPDPTPDELPGLLEADAAREAARDKWLADEARQTRQSAGTGGGI
jgi:hypothetical protein